MSGGQGFERNDTSFVPNSAPDVSGKLPVVGSDIDDEIDSM
jgi:hypothetical protein